MRGVRKIPGRALFAAICVLVLAQVCWWAWVFTRDADLIATLQMENARLATNAGQAEVSSVQLEKIRSEASQRKRMFLSETLFFAAMTCVGLWLLMRALRAERRSREVQRNFIETVSHESKTPLTALKLRLESLVEKSSDTVTRTGLQRALEEVRRLASVLERTMELNRTESQALEFERLDLSEVVKSVVRRLEPWLQAQGAKVEMELAPGVLVLGDFASLQNSVQSLLENAVLYNPKADKQVAIHSALRGGRAFLRVTDNGPGVSAADASRVFERFYRGEGGRSVRGTGLGLYLARVIIHAHRGAIRLAKSDLGACFEVELPRVGVT